MIRQEPDFDAIREKMENPDTVETPVPVEIPDFLVDALGDAKWGVFVPCTGEDDAAYSAGHARPEAVVINDRVMGEIRRRINGYEELLLGSLTAQETIELLDGNLERSLEAVRHLCALLRHRASDLDQQKRLMLDHVVGAVVDLGNLLVSEEELTVADVTPPESP